MAKVENPTYPISEINKIMSPNMPSFHRDEVLVASSDIPQIPLAGDEPVGSLESEGEVTPDNLETMGREELVPGTNTTAGEVLDTADAAFEVVQEQIKNSPLVPSEVYSSPEAQERTIKESGWPIDLESPLNAQAQSLADILTTANGMDQVRVVIIDEAGLGGVARGSGVVGIKRDMVEAALEEGGGSIDPTQPKGAALTGVLAHEIGHSQLRHPELTVQFNAAVEERITETGGSNELRNLTVNYISREIERAGDHYAVEIIEKAFQDQASEVLDHYGDLMDYAGHNDLGSEPQSKPWPQTHHPRYFDIKRIQPYRSDTPGE